MRIQKDLLIILLITIAYMVIIRFTSIKLDLFIEYVIFLLIFLFSGYSLLALLYPSESSKNLFKKPILLLNLSLFLALVIAIIWKYLLQITDLRNLIMVLSIITVIISAVAIIRRKPAKIVVSSKPEKPSPPKKIKKTRSLTGKKKMFRYDLVIITILSILTLILVILPPFNTLPIYYILGSIFILFIPGYVFMVVLFPNSKNVEGIELLGISIALSLPLTSIIGILLNYTPYGIKLGPIIIILSIITLILIPIAIIRRRNAF